MGRLLSELTILLHGVPVGTARLMEFEREQPIAPLLPAELRPRLDWEPQLGIVEGTSLPAFEALVGPAVHRVREAQAAWDRLPSCVGIEEAQARVDDACQQLFALWHELELRDDTGAILPIPVFSFDGKYVFAELEEIPAVVLARLRGRYLGGPDASPPAV